MHIFIIKKKQYIMQNVRKNKFPFANANDKVCTLHRCVPSVFILLNHLINKDISNKNKRNKDFRNI